MACVCIATTDRPRMSGTWHQRFNGSGGAWMLAWMVGTWLMAMGTPAHAQEGASTPPAESTTASEPAPTSTAAPTAAAPASTESGTPSKAGTSSFNPRKVLSFVVLGIPWAWLVSAVSVVHLMVGALTWANRPDEFFLLRKLPFTIHPWVWHGFQAWLLGTGLLIGAVAVVLFVLPEMPAFQRLVTGEPSQG